MSRPTARFVLPLAILAALAVSHCGDGMLTEPHAGVMTVPGFFFLAREV